MTDAATPLVLYVEDEFLIRDTVIEAVEEAGFRVAAATDGSEALSLLAYHNAEIRALVTDINLGRGIDGWEVARVAREAVCGLPVIYVSAASEQDWTSRGVPQSIMIGKPFANTQIVVAICSLITSSDPQN